MFVDGSNLKYILGRIQYKVYLWMDPIQSIFEDGSNVCLWMDPTYVCGWIHPKVYLWMDPEV